MFVIHTKACSSSDAAHAYVVQKVAAKNPQFLKKRKRAASPDSDKAAEEESVVEPAAKLARTEYKSSFMDVLDPPEAGPSSHSE